MSLSWLVDRLLENDSKRDADVEIRVDDKSDNQT